jgi:hypothetical protein
MGVVLKPILGRLEGLGATRRYATNRVGGALAPVVLAGKEAQRLVGMVDFSTPIPLPGHPLAVATGRILITLETVGETRTDITDRREFVLLGDRLLQDVYDSSVYYRASETFAGSLALLR